MTEHAVDVAGLGCMAVHALGGCGAAQQAGFAVEAVQVAGHHVVAAGPGDDLAVAVADRADLDQLADRASRLQSAGHVADVVGHLHRQFFAVAGVATRVVAHPAKPGETPHRLVEQRLVVAVQAGGLPGPQQRRIERQIGQGGRTVGAGLQALGHRLVAEGNLHPGQRDHVALTVAVDRRPDLVRNRLHFGAQVARGAGQLGVRALVLEVVLVTAEEQAQVPGVRLDPAQAAEPMAAKAVLAIGGCRLVQPDPAAQSRSDEQQPQRYPGAVSAHRRPP